MGNETDVSQTRFVPVELLESLLDDPRLVIHMKSSTLAQPAAPVTTQEPVAYADPKALENFKNLAHQGGPYAHEWMWAKPDKGLVPLYTHADAGEVAHWKGLFEQRCQEVFEESTKAIEAWREITILRAQLAERDALLHRASDVLEVLGKGDQVRKRIAALSASVQPNDKKNP